ncbi:MAG TPA: tol-pal system protein YbgF [Kofleriaceae bacterium]
MTIKRYVFWVALASVGCASPVKALREDNRRLSTQVAELRADRRVQDRKLKDLEHELAQVKVATASVEALPTLPVEVVAPPSYADGQRLVGVADDGTEIIYEGDAALGKPAVVDRARRAQPVRVESKRAPAPAVSARVPATSTRREGGDGGGDAASADYRAAVELVKSGKTTETVAALRGFLKSYPRHEYADNAQYWLGEAFYAAKDYQHALVEFRATIETYPRGNKVPDALLKVGYCYYALGQSVKARAVLEQVVNLYGKTEPAALAAKRLESP